MAIAGRPFARSQRPASDIARSLEESANSGDSDASASAEAEEWQISGAAACPEEKTRRQHEKYFRNLRFLSIEQLLQEAETTGHV